MPVSFVAIKTLFQPTGQHLLKSARVNACRPFRVMALDERPSGPYKVAICDARLPDDVSPSLRLRIFYPTSSSVTESAEFFPPSSTSYPDRNVVSVLRFTSVPFAQLLALPLSYIAKLPLPACKTGDILPSQPAHPLMLFSHGLGGSIANYSNFCIDHASHGFIVAAPEHTDGSAFEAIVGSQQTIIPYERYDANRHGASPQFRGRQLETRRMDIAAVFSVLYRLVRSDEGQFPMVPLRSNCPVPSFVNQIDFSNIVLAGHSFGAATALLVGSHPLPFDLPPPRSVICLDAWLAPLKDRINSMKLPPSTDLLFIDMGEAKMSDSIEVRRRLPRLKQSSHSDAITDAVKVVGGLHNDSSDFPLRIPHWLASTLGLTRKDTIPLHLLEAQNLASRSFLESRQSWTAFKEKVSNEEDVLVLPAEISPL